MHLKLIVSYIHYRYTYCDNYIMSQTTSTSDKLVITNKRIVDFYRRNPHFNPELQLMFLVDTFENIQNASKDQVSTSVLSSIYTAMTDSEQRREILANVVNTIKDDLRDVKDSVTKISTDMISIMTMKLNDTKESYISELKELIHKNDNNVSQSITPVLQEHTRTLIDRTSTLLHEILPNNEKFIDTQLKLLQQSIKLDIIQYLSDSKQNTIDNKFNDFATQLDIKFSNLVNKCVNTSEERISQKISLLSDTSMKIFASQDKLSSSVTDIADKFKNSSYKGNFSENILFNVLTSIYPIAEIVDTSKDGSKCGDLLLKRSDKSTIMFENKIYNCNVPQDEVKKFQRDVQLHDNNAIFLSQSSGITGKPNFFIEINNKNNILLYIHKVGYSSDLIKLGVDVIDTISEFIHKKESTEETINIDYSLLEIINREVAVFVTKKKDIIDLVKEQQKTLLHKLDDMSISSTLMTLLNQYFGSTSHRNEHECTICHKFFGRSAASLSAHRRHCKDVSDTNSQRSSSEKIVETPPETPIQNTQDNSNTIVETLSQDTEQVIRQTNDIRKRVKKQRSPETVNAVTTNSSAL